MQTTSEQLSCCHQRYLACKQEKENSEYSALVMGNREPTRILYMPRLVFDKMDEDPSQPCKKEVAARGDNARISPMHLFESPTWLVETHKNTFVNGPVCKQGVCCYQPVHQTYDNLTKQLPITRSL